MELQERASIGDFMTGPMQTNAVKTNETSNASYSNQILGYLLGFSPKLDV